MVSVRAKGLSVSLVNLSQGTPPFSSRGDAATATPSFFDAGSLMLETVFVAGEVDLPCARGGVEDGGARVEGGLGTPGGVGGRVGAGEGVPAGGRDVAADKP